jgi:hypothetical protein
VKPWHWGVAGIVVGLVICWTMRGDPTEPVADWQDSLVAERERSVVAARDGARRDSILAAVGLVVAQQEQELARLRAAGHQTAQALATARQTAQEAEAALASAQTMADSFPRLVVALGAERARGDLAESLVANRDAQIAAGAVLLAAVRDSVTQVVAQRDTARAERDRWRKRATDAEDIFERDRRLSARIGRAAETVAIGAATYGACRDGLLTVGCVAGGLVTGRRILK